MLVSIVNIIVKEENVNKLFLKRIKLFCYTIRSIFIIKIINLLKIINIINLFKLLLEQLLNLKKISN